VHLSHQHFDTLRGPQKATLLLAALIWLLLLPFQFVTAASNVTTGISAHVIKLGGIYAKLGPASAIAVPILKGYELAFKEVDARGGVYGRKIQYVTENDNYDPSQTLPQARRLVQEVGVFAMVGLFGSDDSNQALPYLESQHIPFFDPIGGGADVKGKHWVWQTEPSYAREGIVMARYMAKKLHVHRVAVLYQVGVNEPEVAAIKSHLAPYHAMVLAVPYKATDLDMSSELTRVRQFNPDIVVLTGTLVPTSLFVRDAAATGYKPSLGYFANYPLGDPSWVALTSGAAEGSLVSSYADLTGKNATARAYRAALKRFGGTYSNYGLYGYFNATLFLRALRLAGKNPTRIGLQHVLDTKFRHYKPDLTGELNWTPTYHYGVTQFKIYRIHGTSFVPVTGWLNS
jgi:branched-chain amino acid transport system substrate-binding protein